MKLDDLNPQYNGAELLDELHAALTRYVILPSVETAHAVTLWIAATHAQTAWEHAPRLAAISPEKRCGKSRLMDVVEALAHRAIVTTNISPAALVRCVPETDPPTLCIDEADTIFGARAGDNHEDLRGIINSGHQRNRPYIRYDITTRSNESLPTFAMAMLAGIGDLPDTIMDRAIVVRMRRRAPAESVEPYRTRRDRGPLHDLRDRLHAWADQLVDDLTEAIPEMPVEDRAADTWEPLVAIADAAGGRWPALARTATLKLVAAENEADVETSLGVKLLADIRDTFTDWTVGFMTSADLVAALVKIEESPWRDLDLSTTTLATRLRPYSVRPCRNSTGTARGYRLEDFRDAFSRYAPPPRQEASDRQNRRSGDFAGVSSDGSTRQTPQPVSAPTSGSDTLTGSDGGCRVCGKQLDPALAKKWHRQRVHPACTPETTAPTTGAV